MSTVRPLDRKPGADLSSKPCRRSDVSSPRYQLVEVRCSGPSAALSKVEPQLEGALDAHRELLFGAEPHPLSAEQRHYGGAGCLSLEELASRFCEG